MTASIANDADALREGIARGYLRASEAIEWARLEVIRGEDDRAPLLADLARIDEEATATLLLILGHLAWGAEPERVGRIAAGHLEERLEDGRLEPLVVAQLIYQLVRDGYAPDPSFEAGARRFNDEAQNADPRIPAPPALRTAILAFLAPYRQRTPDGADNAVTDAGDQLTLTVERAVPGGLELAVTVAWHSWSGAIRTRTTREHLAAFAPRVRDFSAHTTPVAVFESGDGRLRLRIEEQGRARRATVAVEIRGDEHRSRPPERLDLVVPTEHALLGDFAADLAELAAVGSGVARLRLIRRWPNEV